MIQANVGLFARLAAAGGEAISPDLKEQRRAIRTNDVEKRWLKGLILKSSPHLIIDSVSSFALGEYEGSLYLIAIGVQIVEPPPELQPVPLNAGMFTAIADELDVPILRTADFADRLVEYIFYPVQEPCELIELEVITPFFQNVALYQVESSSAIVLDAEFGLRAAIAAILGAPEARPLAWSTGALDRLRFMVRDPEERAPLHLLLRALTERRVDAAFLALYRCVEQLFPIPAISELSQDLGLSRPVLGIAAAIERRLGWRRREEDAIACLFAELDTALVDRMLPVVGAVAQDGNQSRPVSKRIYELRNQCVHFRPAHANGDALTVESWPALIDLMLEAVQCLYARYIAAFDVPQDVTVA